MPTHIEGGAEPTSRSSALLQGSIIGTPVAQSWAIGDVSAVALCIEKNNVGLTPIPSPTVQGSQALCTTLECHCLKHFAESPYCLGSEIVCNNRAHVWVQPYCNY